MRGRRNACLSNCDPARLGDLMCYLFSRQHAAMPRLCALAQLYFNHLDLWVRGRVRELGRIKRSVSCAAPEISRAQFPDKIAAALTVVT